MDEKKDTTSSKDYNKTKLINYDSDDAMSTSSSASYSSSSSSLSDK